jgi:NAD(P)-dependent dehydrogenase (short-subunit alcohol dehydrogenase family)
LGQCAVLSPSAFSSPIYLQRRSCSPVLLPSLRGLHTGSSTCIAPGAVGGQRIENVLAGRAKVEGKTVEVERASMLSIQTLKRFVDPKDIAALCVFLASDAGKSISGQVLPIDNGAMKAS